MGDLAAHRDLDPLPGRAAMGIDKVVIGRGGETPARIEEPDARGKEENARAEIAAKQQLVDRHGLGRGANPPATDRAQSLGEGRGMGGDARRGLMVEYPRRTVRVEATGRD